MVTFRNNNRRGRFRSNDRGFKRTGDSSRYKSDFHSNGDFQRKSLNRNNVQFLCFFILLRSIISMTHPGISVA